MGVTGSARESADSLPEKLPECGAGAMVLGPDSRAQNALEDLLKSINTCTLPELTESNALDTKPLALALF